MCASKDKASAELGLQLVKTVDYTKHYKAVISFMGPYLVGRNKYGNCQSVDPKIGNLINVLLRILEVVKDKGGCVQ